jgi:prepilin-type N-terminal cleavage/methylation domain-containing protein
MRHQRRNDPKLEVRSRILVVEARFVLSLRSHVALPFTSMSKSAGPRPTNWNWNCQIGLLTVASIFIAIHRGIVREREVMHRRESGYSLLEMLVVIALVGIVSSAALVQMKTTIAALDADEASNLVVSELSYARQAAVDERRNVLVQFLGTHEIRVTRDEIGGGTTVLADVTLPSGYTFGLAGGVGDTPDAFGNATAVYFNNGTSGTFLGDGTFVDGASVLLNGTVFTIGVGNGSARAVTLSGATGRIKEYWIQGTAWVVR